MFVALGVMGFHLPAFLGTVCAMNAPGPSFVSAVDAEAQFLAALAEAFFVGAAVLTRLFRSGRFAPGSAGIGAVRVSGLGLEGLQWCRAGRILSREVNREAEVCLLRLHRKTLLLGVDG